MFFFFNWASVTYVLPYLDQDYKNFKIIAILAIVHHPVFYLKTQHFRDRIFNWKTGQWVLSKILIVILIYHCHKPIDLSYKNFNLLL
jgi:hypothetical protein